MKVKKAIALLIVVVLAATLIAGCNGSDGSNKSNGNIAVGDIITFGQYEWRVLDVQDKKALLLSEKLIEKRAYNAEFTGITWEECSLREYLNGEFYNGFDAEDKALIAETTLANNDNPWEGASGGNATTDKIFLLSLEEVVRYFGDSGQLKDRPEGEFLIDDNYNSARIANDESGASWWWLRSPGFDTNLAAYVDKKGFVVVGGLGVNDGSGGVRPALWMNLES